MRTLDMYKDFRVGHKIQSYYNIAIKEMVMTHFDVP